MLLFGTKFPELLLDNWSPGRSNFLTAIVLFLVGTVAKVTTRTHPVPYSSLAQAPRIKLWINKERGGKRRKGRTKKK